MTLYLHRLGIALNYGDDPRLQDTHVLNPHWVTNGVYTILNAELIRKARGELHLSDLSKLLNNHDYPADMRRFLMDLMKKFDLCFTFPDDDAHYLIPELLDKQEPAATGEFDQSNTLNFRYDYSVLPEGLLPRFIVRTHRLSEGQVRWRTGVILAFEGCLALVKADPQDRRVSISIAGPTASRRRLLAAIRSNFESIHNDIKGLNPIEMVPLADHPDYPVPYQQLLKREEESRIMFAWWAGDKFVDLNARDLLEGIDLKGSRRTEARMIGEKIKVFYSYSHKDEPFRNDLETHLKILQRQNLIEPWNDRMIDAGDE